MNRTFFYKGTLALTFLLTNVMIVKSLKVNRFVINDFHCDR